MDDDWGYPYDSGNLHMETVELMDIGKWSKEYWEICESWILEDLRDEDWNGWESKSQGTTDVFICLYPIF